MSISDVATGEGLGSSVSVGAGVLVHLAEGVGDGVAVGEAVCVGVCVALGVGESVGRAVAVFPTDLDTVTTGVADRSVRVGGGVGEGLDVASEVELGTIGGAFECPATV